MTKNLISYFVKMIKGDSETLDNIQLKSEEEVLLYNTEDNTLSLNNINLNLSPNSVSWDSILDVKIDDEGNPVIQRTDYRFAFAKWKVNFRPPYKITIPENKQKDSTVTTQRMFADNKQLKKIYKEDFDLTYMNYSQNSSNQSTFNGCIRLEEIEDIGIQSTLNNHYTYYDCKKLHTIEIFRVNEKSTFTNTFGNCNDLKNIFIEGTISNSIAFAQSSKLTKESLDNIIRTLASLEEGKIATLTLHPIVYDMWAGDQELVNLVNDKNWNVAKAIATVQE